jgi:signal peptidase II
MDRTRVFAFLSVVLVCVGCDHATKLAATSLLAPGELVSLAAGVVRLERVHNPGAFLSLGAGLAPVLRSVILLGVVPVALVVVSALFLRASPPRLVLVALGLVAGGGLSNWFDRVLHDGRVTDFVSLGVGSLRTGIFNLADLAVVLGVLALVAGSAREPRGAEEPPS